LKQEFKKGTIMRTNRFTTLLASAILLAGSSAFAIDRGAGMIDAIWLQGASYNGVDYIGARITGETEIQNTGGQWAILASVGGGTLSFDNADDFDALGVSIGVKYYVTELTSISGEGNYTWNNADVNFSEGGATASFKQRMLAPTRAISPYFRLVTSLNFLEKDDDSYNVLAVAAITGCDFVMNDTMAFVFEGGVSESDAVSGDGVGRQDGWFLSLAMKYYWE
jgi:hypothetical protein